jgi:hypothetical protein
MSVGNVTFCRVSGKLGYLNEDHANQAARRIGQRTDRYFRPYLCPYCRWWHLTRRPHNRRNRHD